MGVAEFLLRKHTAIAKVLIPCSVGYGFLYTIQNNSNPLLDAKNSILGTPDAPMAFTMKRSTIGAENGSQ